MVKRVCLDLGIDGCKLGSCEGERLLSGLFPCPSPLPFYSAETVLFWVTRKVMSTLLSVRYTHSLMQSNTMHKRRGSTSFGILNIRGFSWAQEFVDCYRQVFF